MAKIKMWVSATVLAAVVIFAVGYFLALSPQKSHAASLRAQASQQQQQNDSLKGQIATLRKQEAQVPSEQAEIAKIKGMIPDTPALPGYVRFLNSAASASHVELLSISPVAPAAVKAVAPTATASPSASSGSGTTGAATTSAAGQNLSAIRLTLTVNGDYFALQQFLAQLEKSTRTTIVSSVAMAPGAALQPQQAAGAAAAPAAAAPGWKTLQAQITATIFMSNEPATATGSAQAGAAAKTTPSARPSSSASGSANS